tara:strand:+ start:2213 stop:3277 length:1065 start_codon:yes stop_codon:yes gene_type:complete
MGGWFDTDKPDPPNIAGANEAGVWANVEGTAIQKLIANAMKFGRKINLEIPTFDAKGNKTGTKELSYDFKDYSDADSTREEMEFGAEAADFMAKTMLDVQKKYGVDFVAQRKKELEASDPTGAAIREKYGEEVLAALERGPTLDPRMAREVDQASYAHAAATGNVLGTGQALATGERRGDAAWRNWQQTLVNSAAFLSGTTPAAQFGQLSGAQSGASPFSPMGINNQGLTLDPNAGAKGQQWAMNAYNTEMNWAAQQQPIGAQILGMATGGFMQGVGDYAATNWLGGKKACHVAREVFGADNPEWLLFYDWKELKAPAWFRKLYNRFSVQVARFISDKPKLKDIIRNWMRSKIA